MMLDTGMIDLCTLVNSEGSGNLPKPTLHIEARLNYGEKSISYSRQYQALGVNQQIDMLIHINDEGMHPFIGWFAVDVESNNQFRIDNVTPINDDDGLKGFDLTLSRLEKLYEVE